LVKVIETDDGSDWPVPTVRKLAPVLAAYEALVGAVRFEVRFMNDLAHDWHDRQTPCFVCEVNERLKAALKAVEDATK
jgi:hypothetical protein